MKSVDRSNRWNFSLFYFRGGGGGGGVAGKTPDRVQRNWCLFVSSYSVSSLS